MKTLFLPLFLFFSGIVFSQKSTISGKITGFKEGVEVLLGDFDLGDIIQKSTIQNDKFSFNNPAQFSPKRMYMIIKEDTTMYWFNEFYIDTKNVFFSGDKRDIPNYVKIKGSKSNDEKIAFKKSYEKFQNKWDSINDLIAKKKSDTLKYKKEEIDNDRAKRSKINEQIEFIKIENIKSNPNRYIALLELYWLKEKIGKEEVRKLYNQFGDDLKKSDFGINLKIYLDLEKVLQEGDYFEDFEAKDINGVNHKISQYKGKYILLDFIQTYCYACLLSNDELKKINEKYKNKVQIITFCNDKSEKTWQDGYKEHQIQWVSLWNEEGNFGRINQLYGTDGTPTFILINPEGKIIKKEYGYDEGNLETILTDVLNKK